MVSVGRDLKDEVKLTLLLRALIMDNDVMHNWFSLQLQFVLEILFSSD